MVNSSNDEQKEIMDKSATTGMPQPFSNRWDPVSKHAAQPTSSHTGMQSSQVILDALRLRRGSETAKWLNSLEDSISQQSPSTSQSGLPAATALPIQLESMQEFIANEQIMIEKAIHSLDKIFDEFELYSLAFNRNAQGTDFLVSTTRPIKNENAEKKHVAYAGHLSTKLWAMVIRGSANKIEAFIIPAELLLAFSIHSMEETGYKPLLTVEAEWREGKPIWHIENNVITAEKIPMLAKELFGDLIRVATGQMSESDLFAHPTQQFDLGKNLAVTGQEKSLDPNIAPTLNQNSLNTLSTNTAAAFPQSNNQSGFSLKSINAIEQSLTLINEDINQLLEIGKGYLQSENNTEFEKIKILTAKLGTLKENLSVSLANLRKNPE